MCKRDQAALSSFAPDLVDGTPYGQGAIGHHQHRCAQITQDAQPRLGRLAMTRPHRQYLFASVAHGTEHDQQRHLVFLQPSLDVDAIRPGVDQLTLVQSALLPGLKLFLSLGPQASDGRGRQRRAVAQQTPQCQFEVPLRQSVQVELGQ